MRLAVAAPLLLLTISGVSFARHKEAAMSLPSVLRSTGSGVSAVVGLALDATTVGNEEPDATTLHSFTLPGGTMEDDGDSMAFEYAGSLAGNADSQIQVKFGGQTILDTGEIDPPITGWIIQGRIIRTAADTVKATAWIGGLGVGVFLSTPLTIDLESDQALQLIGTGVADNDVVKDTAFVSFLNARP